MCLCSRLHQILAQTLLLVGGRGGGGGAFLDIRALLANWPNPSISGSEEEHNVSAQALSHLISP